MYCYTDAGFFLVFTKRKFLDSVQVDPQLEPSSHMFQDHLDEHTRKLLAMGHKGLSFWNFKPDVDFKMDFNGNSGIHFDLAAFDKRQLGNNAGFFHCLRHMHNFSRALDSEDNDRIHGEISISILQRHGNILG